MILFLIVDYFFSIREWISKLWVVQKRKSHNEHSIYRIKILKIANETIFLCQIVVQNKL